jgi:hypothetical protein
MPPDSPVPRRLQSISIMTISDATAAGGAVLWMETHDGSHLRCVAPLCPHEHDLLRAVLLGGRLVKSSPEHDNVIPFRKPSRRELHNASSRLSTPRHSSFPSYLQRSGAGSFSFFRVLGVLMLLSFCLIAWGVVLSWPFVGWEVSALGVLLCALTFACGWICLSEGRKS